MTIYMCNLRNYLFCNMEIMSDDYINPIQYSAYKEWLEKVEKAEDELFWRDNNLLMRLYRILDHGNYVPNR